MSPVDPASAKRRRFAALQNAAFDAERTLSWLRAGLASLAAARLGWLLAVERNTGIEQRAALAIPLLFATAVGSAWLSWELKGRRASLRILYWAAWLEVLGAGAVLAVNVVFPWPDYPGILRLPETFVLFLVVVGSSFRALRRLALISACGTVAVLASLISLDVALHGQPLVATADLASLYVILLVTAGALAYLQARRSEHLIDEGTQLSESAERAKKSVAHFAQGHHDASSVVSAALYSLQQVSLQFPSNPAVNDLESDMRRLRATWETLKRSAFLEASALEAPEPVDVGHLLSHLRDLAERAVAPTRIAWSIPTGPVVVMVAGGGRTLSRVVLNLLVNAMEGSGREGATLAHVSVEELVGTISVVIRDDGPGITDDSGKSTKANGTGLGGALARRVAKASGGAFSLHNASPRGAVARLTFPLAHIDLPDSIGAIHQARTTPI